MPKAYVLKLVDHKNKKVFYRVEADPEGKDSLGNYITYSTKIVNNGKISQLLPHHKAVSLYLATHGRGSVEQQILHEVDYPTLKIARQMTKDLRRQMAKVDQALGYEKIA